MNDLLDNFIWNALATEHSSLAIGTHLARRYPSDIAPFAGLQNDGIKAYEQLRDLLDSGEAIYIESDDVPVNCGLSMLSRLPALQMVYAGDQVTALKLDTQVRIHELTAADSPAMSALADIAFPGFFRQRTYLMGAYYGIWFDGALVSMAGERLALPGMREISAVCTHPNHTGRGYAAMLIYDLLERHRVEGWKTFLHVGAHNKKAIALYERLGFLRRIPVEFLQICRV